MNKTRILSVLLALVMVLGMLPVSAFATDSEDTTTGDLVVEITHVSLNPAKDALGFKAKVEGSLESVTQIGFAFRVNGGTEKVYTLTKTPEDGIFTARVQNILANKGGEATLEAYAFVRTADATVSSQWQATSMKDALQAVDAAWHTAGYTQAQKSAVKALCNQYKAQVEPWSLENIFGGFFGNAGDFTTSDVIDLSTDSGEAPYLVLDAHKSTPLYTYIKGLNTQNFSFETTVQVNSIIENEYYPKFGMLVNGQTEMVKFYLDMNTALQVSQAGVVHQNTGMNDDWAYQSTNTLSETLDMSAQTVTLKLVRDGVNYYFYVNGALVLTGSDLTDEIGAVGFFSFGTVLTLTDYTVEADNAVYQDILTQAQADAEAFHQVRNQILAESASYTVETLELGAKVWNGRGYTFVEVPEELIGQSYLFGKISTQIDMTVAQSGYLYVMTPLTTHANFPDNILAEGSGWTQVNIASDWCFANYNNPIDTLVFERKVTPGETISIDASWSVVVVSAQRINMYDLLGPNDGNTLKEVAIGEKIWSDEDMAYTFISMPEQLLGKQYVYGSINGGVDVTIGRNGYIYVITHPRSDSHFASSVDNYNFKRLELPQWTFADYSTKRHTWVYELKVSSGDQIKLDPWWGVLIGSETQLDLTGNGVTVANNELAEISSDSYDSLPVELKQQVFSDQAPYYYHTIPYWLAGKSYLRAPLNGGSATVTKAGKLYLLGRNAANGQKYLDVGFTHVMDLDFEPWGGTGLGGGNFAAMGFALYEKDVAVGETVTWGRWGVPLFYCDKQLPLEPVKGISGIEITKMPTKTTYQLGESFDQTGLVVSGIDYSGNKVVLDREEYLVAPAVLSADVPAVSVIVNDKICAIPVTVTDENGNDLTDYTPADMSGFTTQKAPIITGSISLSTVDAIVTTIQKEETDGATGFIVYLTTLAESERTVENLKRIADCTEYPVMALAYGNYDNLEMRLNLWRMAVEAGFDAVDIPMDTYSVSDDASKTSYAGTIFACAAPKEVSLDADVIAQQQAFMAELRSINPDVEILMSAHVGVALNETQGVALAKEMEARGADIAKLVLASTENLEDTLQTNMVLQEELTVPFFYNCAGAASRPFRTAAGLMGTQVVFCCAPYHEINAYVYDYAKDLREFYNTIPELYQELKVEENTEGVSLSTDYFLETEDGKYTLSTTGYTDAMVDSVQNNGVVINGESYRVKGSLSLTNANTWGQARILATADENNGYVIALEKVGESAYQIFTMSRLNESAWNDWRLISHYEVNGDRNSIDFELVVDGGKITFLLDDKICYENSRVTMTASTPQFGASNVATATVSGLNAQVFADSAEAESYLATKEQAEYVSRFQTRMDALYNEYIVENNCANKGGTLIFGDSYMDFWSTWEGQTGLTKYENGYNVGIGGSTTKDWLHAYEQLVKPFAAQRMIINIGYNDINVWGDDGEEFAQNLKTLFETIHADFPETEIYYIYINPSPSVYANGAYTNQKVEDAINRSKELVASLDYVTGVDIFDLMTTEDDLNPVAAYYVSDNIHLSAEGYSALSNYLRQVVFGLEPVVGYHFGDVEGYITTSGIDLSNDTEENGIVSVVGGGTQYGYLKNSFSDKLYVEAQFNVSQILNSDAYPKFGLILNGATEMVSFYVDMTTGLTSEKVGIVHYPSGQVYDWANSVQTAVSGMSFTGQNKVKLAVVRDGSDVYFYVNDVLVMQKIGVLAQENTAAGIFTFNTQLTVSDYILKTGDAAAEAIVKAKADCAFFDNADVDLSRDYGANVGTVNVNTGKSEYVYVKDFSKKDFYFETKIHVNEIYNNEASPKFGIFAQNDTTREHFYVDMTPGKTASAVGVMTASYADGTWTDNWDGAKTETVEGINFSGSGEYVTLGLKKEDGRFLLYVNGEFALYLDSTITGNSAVGVFGINTGMELKEYFVNVKEGIDSLLTLTTEGEISTVELGGTIWSDKSYTFYEMPQEFIGESYIKNAMKSDIAFTVKKDGYIYVLTTYRGHSNSIADELEPNLYDRIEIPGWYLASYTNKVDYWAYARQIKAGETVSIPGNSNWHMVIVSELPIDPSLHQMNNYVFADHQLAQLTPTEDSGGTLATVANGVYPFTDRGADASNPAYLQNLPDALVNQMLIQDNLTDPVQATVTKAGKVFLIASTSDTRKAYFTNEEQGYTFVADLKAEYGNILSASSYNANGYGLYVKDVEVGDFERTRKSYWSIVIFGSDEKLPAEPPVSIEVTQMPTKTIYKLGEDFDPTGLVVMGTDKYGNVTQLDASQYVTVPGTFTAHAYAAAVIVDDMIVAIPVTITDAEGNELTDDTVVDTTKYTTQKAPLLNGSVKRSTPDEVIAAIAKMEADGATAFNVHLTSLNTEYRNAESFKQIADCTDYPVMAIAYGSESNREYRIGLMKTAVEAGFDIVDIPMNTFDADSQATLAGTVFESANPAEVSMDATVIEQQKALIQEFKDLGAEVLMSAHIGVSLTEEEGVALAKEMEARGADVAKIVLGSSANSMQDVVMQTNQTLQNEVGIKFYYNASGTASKPYRTASCLLGTHMIFCYAEYHESNLETYDYIKDLKEIYGDLAETTE